MMGKSYFKIFLIVIQIGGLYGIGMIGNLIAEILRIPIPGSIIGLLLLLGGLYFKIIPETFIKDGAGFILVILPLFFIPATVGVVQYPELLSMQGIVWIIIVMLSTFLTMIVAGRMSEWYEMKKERVGS